MTARNTVFRLIARWFMRFEAAGSILRLLLFGGTFLTTGLSALQQYGYAEYAWPFIGVVTTGTVAFAYAYTRFGVYNQKNRDNADMGDNYSGPTMLMDKRIEARQLAYLAYALQNGREQSFDELESDLEDITHREWADLRDGVDVTEIQEVTNE